MSDWGNSWDDSANWGSPPNQYAQQSYPNQQAGGQQNYYSQQQNQQHNQQQQFSGYYDQNSAPNYGFQPQQFLSHPMAGMAQQIGGDYVKQQQEKLSKYISGFNLKYYFAVDNSYVGKKLGILLFPFLHKDWALKYSDSEGPVSAKDDVNAPDLYIPLMAFVTYVLVSGFVLGTQGRFSPEILGILTSNAFIWIIIENIVIFVSKYLMNISQAMSVWHSLSFSTYKFVGMIFCLVMFMSGGRSFYYGTLAYTALTLVYFLLQTVRNFVFDANHFGGDDGRKRKLMLMLFVVVSQPFIMWWLTSGVTSFDYGKFVLAELAMSKMGVKGDAADVPLTDDGDVDYEALLKMP